jgi:hypothetical protein
LTVNPELCKEWDYEKNKLGPENYTKGSKAKVWWKCKKCGNTWPARISNRTNGNGCKKCASSKGEEAIHNYLKEKQIEYKAEKRFKECRNKRPLPFDFYIPQHNLLIEYQGIQHYEYIEGLVKTKQAFQQTQTNDQIKRDFCKSQKKLKLLAIPYTYFDKIEPMLDKFFETNKLPRLKKPTKEIITNN